MKNTFDEERRKYPRFSDRALAGASVGMEPCPPLFGDTVYGYLVDLSAGGMGIVISDVIPKNVFLRMTMTLPDGFVIESAVKVRRIIQQGRGHDYLHGVEFLNPSPEMIQRIIDMAKDILACNQRTQEGAKEICVESCGLSQFCRRPQRIAKNIRPVILQFTEELGKKDQPAEEQSTLKAA